MQTLDVLEKLAPVFATRELFVAALREAGLSQAIAQWLAMNLERVDGGFAFKIDLAAIRSMIQDYFNSDLWPVLESPPYAADVHLVIGGRSDVFNSADRERARSLETKGVTLDVVKDAGHWVHVDAPEEMLRVIDQRMRSSSTRASSTST